MRFLLHLARSALPRPLRLPSIRQLSATPALCARQRRVRTEDPATLRAKAKEQLAELDRRGIDIENSEDGKLKAIGGEEGAEEAIKRVESNREDPEADWFVASKRTSKLDSGDRKESKTTDLETGAKEKDTAAFPHDETKGDFIPRWMRNLSVAERRSAGVLLNEDADDFEIDEEAVATGRAKIVRAEEYTDAALLELLQRENAINIVSIDVRGKMDGVETVIVCSGQTGRQLYRMASRVRSTFKYCFPTLPTLHGARDRVRDPITNKLVRSPAGTAADWLILELGPATVHFMLPSAREFYDIEGLWSKEAGELEEMVREGARELEREDWEGAVDLEKRQARRERFEKVVGKRGVGGGGKKRRGQEGGYDDYIRGGRGREVVG